MFSRWFKLGLPAQGVLSKKWGYWGVLGKKCPSGDNVENNVLNEETEWASTSMSIVVL